MVHLGVILHIIVGIFVGFTAVECASSTFPLRSNETVLFLGGMNVVTGGSMPYGFVNVFKREVQSLYSNVTILTAGFADDDGEQLLSNLDTLLTQSTRPNKVVISAGLEMFAGHTGDSSFGQLKFELESLVARLKQDNIEVILCPLTLQGERVDIENELDDIIHAYATINKQVASEYEVMYVNIAPQVNAFLEHNNIDLLDNSVLTLEGSILNEKGHMFVALALLRGFGVKHHSLMQDNVVLREQLRIHEIKQELNRVGTVEIVQEVR